MFLAFPEFNLYSTPLLVLVLQGLIFGFLLLTRSGKQKSISDLLLGFLVLITCYHRTTYTIGFMGWYDTYRETKINYWLIPLTFAIGPLIYLYLRSITFSNFKFRKKDWLHFLPLALLILFRVFILVYDAAQPGYDLKQNGVLMERWNNGVPGAFFSFAETMQQALYLAFSIQLYYTYRRQLKNYFSNTFNLELNWMRNFLLIYTFLFLYGNLQEIIDLTVESLSWIQKWWNDFFSALAVIYIGIKGYFTSTDRLKGLDFDPARTLIPEKNPRASSIPAASDTEELKEQSQRVQEYMDHGKAYLDPELNLRDMASELNMSRAKLSETINLCFGKNFNDYINSYRIGHFKKLLEAGNHKQHSLLGIAFDSGFNSKATFNRVFRKIENRSPSEYLKTLE